MFSLDIVSSSSACNPDSKNYSKNITYPDNESNSLIVSAELARCASSSVYSSQVTTASDASSIPPKSPEHESTSSAAPGEVTKLMVTLKQNDNNDCSLTHAEKEAKPETSTQTGVLPPQLPDTTVSERSQPSAINLVENTNEAGSTRNETSDAMATGSEKASKIRATGQATGSNSNSSLGEMFKQ